MTQGAREIDWSSLLPPPRVRAGRIASAPDALRAIPDGSRVFVSAACATPFRLLEQLDEQRAQFTSLEIVVGHLRRALAPFAHAGAPFRFTSLHASDAFGALRGGPWLDVLPCRYSDYGRHFTAGGAYPCDVALVQVSAPGPDGRVSLGVSTGSTLPVVFGAPLVIAQMNPQMPYTFGAGELPQSAFDFLVEADEPLLEVATPPLDDVARAIGAHAAGEIPDGATLQFGIGAVPDAIVKALRGHRDLALHGGMIGDACIELVEVGALSGARKQFGRGALIAGEVIGTRRLYDLAGDPGETRDLASERPELVHELASDLARAAMTAEAVRDATGAPLEWDAELHERNFGDLRGRPYESLGFDAYAQGYTPPNGESWEMFHARVERAWPRVLAVAARTQGPLAVVTHGLVCRAILAFHAQPAPGLAQPAGFRNTSVSVLEGTPWRATLIDCVVHLDEVRETAAT